MSDNDTRREFLDKLRYARDFWTPFVENTQTYVRAAAGDTWSKDELHQLNREGREPIEFNIIRRSIEFFSGFLRDNINQIVYGPVEGSDQKTADQFTKLSYYIWDKGLGFPMFLDAADECFKAGIALCGIQMDYSSDFINGDISFYRRTFNSFYLDPTFERLDLSDCGFAITRDLVGREGIKMLLPDVNLDEVPRSFRDDKFLHFRPSFNNQSQFGELVAYDQYFVRTTRPRKYLVDRNTAFARDISKYDSEEMERLNFGLNRIQRARDNAEDLGLDLKDIPNVEIMTVQRPFVELNVMLNGEQVYKGIDNTGIAEHYPFVPLICYMEPSLFSSKRIQGVAAAEYTNQRQFNKRHMKIQDMFDSVIATGYKYLIGSINDPSELLQSGQNRLIGIDPDNPAGINAVEQLSGINVPASLMEYPRMLDELSLTLANLNQSVLGTDEGGNSQVSGRLAQVRIAQGLRSNRKVFDNIESSQQILGSLILKCIQAKYPPEKIERILNETPTEQFYDSSFDQYDAQVKEGLRSKSQKDAYYFELKELAREGFVQVPQTAFIDALQVAGIDDLREHIEKAQQQQAEQQQKMDEQERVAIQLANSQAVGNLALAEERKGRTAADQALASERLSEASENRAQAALARAKTITEIADMEDARILRVLEFVNMLHRQEIQDREGKEQQLQQATNSIQSEVQSDMQQQEERTAGPQQASENNLNMQQ